MECWSAGVLERRSAGVLECWSAGVLECWSAGALEHWSTGALEHWSVGALERWSQISRYLDIPRQNSRTKDDDEQKKGNSFTLQCSITPSLHHSITPSLRRSGAPLRQAGRIAYSTKVGRIASG
jgi:hypothetical protein